jgi:hypothetical protein
VGIGTIFIVLFPHISNRSQCVCVELQEWRVLFSRDLHRAVLTKDVIHSALRQYQARGPARVGDLNPLWVNELSRIASSFCSISYLDLRLLPLVMTDSVFALSFLAITPDALQLALPRFPMLRTLCLYIRAGDAAAPAVVAELAQALVPVPKQELHVQLGHPLETPRTSVGDQAITLATLSALASLPGLRSFTASVLALSSAAAARAAYVKEIAAMTGLQSLSLVGVPSADLHPWAALTGLTSLHLEAMWARDEALMFLTALSGLRSLQLRSARFTARIPGMVAVATGLTELALIVDGHGHMAHTLTDASLQDLSRLSRLADLSLNRERLTGQFMRSLAGVLPLTRLALLSEDSQATCSYAPAGLLICPLILFPT